MTSSKGPEPKKTRKEIFLITKKRAGKALLGMAAVGLLEEAMGAGDVNEKVERMRPYVEDIDTFAEMAGAGPAEEALSSVYELFGADIGIAASLYHGRPLRAETPAAAATGERTRKTSGSKKTPESEYVSLSFVIQKTKTRKHGYDYIMGKVLKDPEAQELLEPYGKKSHRVLNSNVDPLKNLIRKKYTHADDLGGTETNAPGESEATDYAKLSYVVQCSGKTKLSFTDTMRRLEKDDSALVLMERHGRGYRVPTENIAALKEIIRGYKA